MHLTCPLSRFILLKKTKIFLRELLFNSSSEQQPLQGPNESFGATFKRLLLLILTIKRSSGFVLIISFKFWLLRLYLSIYFHSASAFKLSYARHRRLIVCVNFIIFLWYRIVMPFVPQPHSVLSGY